MISMISAISRRARVPGWQLAAANSIRIRPFTAKAPLFDEKPLAQSHEQSDGRFDGQSNEKSDGRFDGQSNEKSDGRSNGQSYRQSYGKPYEQPSEQFAATVGRPTFRRTMLPIYQMGRNPSSDVIACIEEDEMSEILLGRTRYLYRKFFFNESTRYVWLYVKRPVGKLSYIAEIGGCKLVPQELDMLPYYTNKRMEALREASPADKSRTIMREAGEGSAGDGGVGALPNISYHTENPRRFNIPGLPRYAFLIRHFWEIIWPSPGITCEELWERRFLQSPPPPKYIVARNQMVTFMPLERQRMLF